MEQIDKKDSIYLGNYDYLKVIKIDGIKANLSLYTSVIVNTEDNSCKVKYTVSSFVTNNEEHNRIRKTFINYNDAYNYYIEIYSKYQYKY